MCSLQVERYSVPYIFACCTFLLAMHTYASDPIQCRLVCWDFRILIDTTPEAWGLSRPLTHPAHVFHYNTQWESCAIPLLTLIVISLHTCTTQDVEFPTRCDIATLCLPVENTKLPVINPMYVLWSIKHTLKHPF
jgi:hypothetical protein